MAEQVKIGEVAYLKSTSEPVFVLGLSEAQGFVEVRRPINTRDGIHHLQETFNLIELETYKDKVDREVAELQYGRDLVMATKAKESLPGGGGLN